MRRLTLCLLIVAGLASAQLGPLRITIDSGWAKRWRGTTTLTPRAEGDSWMLAPWWAIRFRIDSLYAGGDWDTSKVKAGYLIVKTDSADTIIIAVDSVTLAGLLAGATDSTAFHHNDTADSASNLWADTITAKTLYARHGIYGDTLILGDSTDGLLWLRSHDGMLRISDATETYSYNYKGPSIQVGENDSMMSYTLHVGSQNKSRSNYNLTAGINNVSNSEYTYVFGAGCTAAYKYSGVLGNNISAVDSNTLTVGNLTGTTSIGYAGLVATGIVNAAASYDGPTCDTTTRLATMQFVRDSGGGGGGSGDSSWLYAEAVKFKADDAYKADTLVADSEYVTRAEASAYQPNVTTGWGVEAHDDSAGNTRVSIERDDTDTAYLAIGGNAATASNAALLQGKDTNAIHAYVSRDSAKVQKGDTIVGRIKTAFIQPPADSVQALQIFKADGTTSIFNVDSRNARVGIGTTTPSAALQISSADYPPLRVTRTSSQTSTIRAGVSAEHATTSDMADGFGSGFSLDIKDNAGVSNPIAGIYGIRAGADNSGTIVFQTYSAGFGYSRMFVGGAATATVSIDTAATRSTEKLFVKGNVLIGGNLAVDSKIAVGAASAAATSIVDLTSTTLGFLPPRMSTAQRDAISTPAEGLIVYDLTVHKVSVYNGTVWTYLAIE